MQYKETDLNQKSHEAALASQEQVLPLVRELKGAELDFVAGGMAMAMRTNGTRFGIKTEPDFVAGGGGMAMRTNGTRFGIKARPDFHHFGKR